MSVPQRADGQKKQNTSKDYDFYRDVAVLAFPTPVDSQYRIKDWESKNLFNPDSKAEQFSPDDRNALAKAVTRADTVVNLGDHMEADGTLNWNPPKGDWTVLRFGYTTTAANNRPGSRGAIGLQLDKLSRKAVDVHWNALLDAVIADAGGKRAFTTILIEI